MALDAAMWEIRLRIGVTDREANVLPVRDGRPHIESEACRCRPSVETLDNGGRVVLHNSRDGREFFEREVAGNA